MKSKISFYKRLTKGMTLLELVVAMALTSIVVAGAGALLFAMNKHSNSQIKSNVYLSDAKSLSYAIDKKIKESKDYTISFNENKNLGKTSVDLLFTIGSKNYGFSKNVFGVLSNDESSIEDAIYTSKYNMYINIQKENDIDLYVITINYGNSYKEYLTLIERL